MDTLSEGSAAARRPRRGLMGFPLPVWLLMAVEFTERFGYYAAAFMLFTYCTNMLRTGASGANAILNGLYVIIPVAACISSGWADGKRGRPVCLLVFFSLYVVGLVLLAISSVPLLYGDFPNEPTTLSYVFFGAGLGIFGFGYGGLKVCIGPMMADSVCEVYPPSEVDQGCSVPASCAPTEKAATVISRMFRCVYWVTNLGALIGILVAPLLRNLDSRRVEMGSSTFSTGYYYGFILAAVAATIGLSVFIAGYRTFHRSRPAPTFVFFRVIARAIKYRLYFATGLLVDPEFETLFCKDLLDYASYRAHDKRQDAVVVSFPERGPNRLPNGCDGTPHMECEESTGVIDGENPSRVEARSAMRAGTPEEEECLLYDLGDLSCRGWAADGRAALRVCKAFVALPIYWLLCNQFSTNLMYQVGAMNLPQWMPPEIFNNINTIALLLFLALCDRLIFPLWYGSAQPPACPRVVAGFLAMFVSMVWCGTVQVFITQRGHYSRSDEYILKDGASRLSALWLVFPYVLQGIAAALVDTTVMEVAYVHAPERMKGTVMALYWVASSLSGFLGLALSPIMRPSNAVALFFAFAGLLGAVTILFYVLNASETSPLDTSLEPCEGVCEALKTEVTQNASPTKEERS